MQASAAMDEQLFQQVASNQILQLAKQEEERIDAQIKKLEEMDEDDFEVLRQKRLEKLKRQEQQKAEWRLLGHGVYSELPNQQAFFDAAKRSPRMVVHFYRPTTRYCQVVDAHFERLAQRHLETRFCKINAEKAPYLVEKLNIFLMPTLLLIKDGETVKHLRGFDELGGTDEFSSDMLAYVLSTYKVLTSYEGGPPETPSGRGAGGKGVNSIRMAVGGAGGPGPRSSSIREGINEKQYDSDASGDDSDY